MKFFNTTQFKIIKKITNQLKKKKVLFTLSTSYVDLLEYKIKQNSE